MACDSSGDASIPVIKIYGTHLQFGYEVGQLQKSYIENILTDINGDYKKIVKPFYDSRAGRVVCDELFSHSQFVYPEYVQEIQGMANAVGIDPMTMFLLTIQGDITAICLDGNNQNTGEGCTSLMLKNSGNNSSWLLHNEDVLPNEVHLGWVVEAHISSESSNQRQEDYVTLHTGTTSGHTFGYNSNGVALSVNVEFPKNINTKGIPRRIVERATLSSRSVDEAIQISTKGNGIASGDNINVAQMVNGIPKMAAIERFSTLSGKPYAVRWVESDQLVYAVNEYQKSKTPMNPDPSSQHRIVRIHELLKPSHDLPHYPRFKSDLLNILSDTKHPIYPIYRNGAPPDILATSFTACFDITKGTLDIMKGKPNNPVARTQIAFNGLIHQSATGEDSML